tara:strand:- start:74 stop:910 length:837 start_codon:yes stop_codon:yes gene_type:complete
MKGVCAPKQFREHNFTCYNTAALLKIRNNWNLRNKKDMIKTNIPQEIWLELKNKFKYTCDIESCWLIQESINAGLDRNILNYTFAPTKPVSWKKNPNEWLDSNDIRKVMKQYENSFKKFKFIGPSPIDYDSKDSYDDDGICVWPELCEFSLIDYLKKNIESIGFIFNLDKHTQDGSHWCAMYLDLKKKQLYYFDSYGKPIHKNMNRFGKTVVSQGNKFGIPIEFIKLTRVHQKKDSECGIYSLYFISSLLTNKHDYKYFEDKRIPDDEIFKYRSIFFS